MTLTTTRSAAILPDPLLAQARDAFGPAPRALGERDLAALAPRPPAWMPEDDPLRAVYRDYGELLRRGEIVWGYIVQANALLFAPGPTDCPADVVFGERASANAGLLRLGRIADALSSLKGAPSVTPALADVGAALAAEKDRHFRVPVPPFAAEGGTFLLSSMMVHRRDIPTGQLLAPFFPLLVCPDLDSVTLLPRRFWPEPVERAFRLWSLPPA